MGVDFAVVSKPNDWVGGFSIANSTRNLPIIITLVVKNSKYHLYSVVQWSTNSAFYARCRFGVDQLIVLF